MIILYPVPKYVGMYKYESAWVLPTLSITAYSFSTLFAYC